MKICIARPHHTDSRDLNCKEIQRWLGIEGASVLTITSDLDYVLLDGERVQMELWVRWALEGFVLSGRFYDIDPSLFLATPKQRRYLEWCLDVGCSVWFDEPRGVLMIEGNVTDFRLRA